MSLRRRAVLAAALGLVAACTPPQPRHRGSTTTEPAPPTTPTGPTALQPTTPTSSTALQPTTTAPRPTQPTAAPSDRAATIAAYRDARPTTFGLTVPGVVTRLDGSGVALTFDACGGPGGGRYDQALIATLRELRTPATLFLNARWIDANPAAFADLAADPLFDIANHGTRHLPLTVTGRPAYGIQGTRDPAEVYDEVATNHAKLTALLGRPPAFFRSGTAHYDDVATRIVAALGEKVIGFDVNADAGARHSPTQVQRAMAAVRPGSIVIAHMNNPTGGTARGMAMALPDLLARGIRFTHLR
ncbi:polysaccharide deacetylase family protein [Actinokineospora sp. HUAS TT18]|uniref:polysaccharide deacetylase family protein n=1 Tax=Actinokineospora sp. HUAS TT18 TaxID=3447451 RepID=UPI003F51F44F